MVVLEVVSTTSSRMVVRWAAVVTEVVVAALKRVAVARAAISTKARRISPT